MFLCCFLVAFSSNVEDSCQQFFKADLVIINSFRFCLSEKVFISPSFLKDSFICYSYSWLAGLGLPPFCHPTDVTLLSSVIFIILLEVFSNYHRIFFGGLFLCLLSPLRLTWYAFLSHVFISLYCGLTIPDTVQPELRLRAYRAGFIF